MYYLDKLDEIYFHQFLKADTFTDSLNRSLSKIGERVTNLSNVKIKPDEM